MDFLEFSRASIHDIMRQISRWYDTEVVYEGKIPNDEFVGKIERNVKPVASAAHTGIKTMFILKSKTKK